MPKIYTLNDKHYDGAESLALISQEYLDINIDISKYDAIIFTSQNAIKPLLQHKELLLEKDIYAISYKSYQSLIKAGVSNAINIDAKSGDEFATSLISLLKDKRVLYPRAKKVESNLIDILSSHSINLDDIVVYETLCSKSHKIIEKNSTIIFSSPSSVKCFFQNYKWDESYRAIALGKTTASFLPKGIKYQIPKETSIKKSITLAKS
jgi:uroporphyrinogen-III synthase